MERTQIKCYLNTSDIKRFDLERADRHFDALLAKIRSAYSPDLITDMDTLKLYWLDDESEQITLTNTSELNYAIQFLHDLQLTPLKLVIFRGVNKGKKTETKITKPEKMVRPAGAPLKPVVCSGCDQVILNNGFKSYVSEGNLCQKCSGPDDSQDTYEQRPASPILTDFKKAMENLRKKINKDLNTIYLKNFKHLIPSYKMSNLSKQEAASETMKPTTEEAINEEFKRLEDVISEISRPLNGVTELDETDLAVAGVLASTSSEANGLSTEILTDQKMADIFLTLNAMGLEDDEDGCLKALVVEKKGDIGATVESYFDLCFQKIIRDASNEKRNSGFVKDSANIN